MIQRVSIDGREFEIDLDLSPEHAAEPGSFLCKVDGEPVAGSALLIEPGILSLVIANRSYRCILDRAGETPSIFIDGDRFSFSLADRHLRRAGRQTRRTESEPLAIKAAMPGRIMRLLAQAGSLLQAHQPILAMEAMKMQNEVKTPRTGRLVELRVAPGDTVNAGQVLAVIE